MQINLGHKPRLSDMQQLETGTLGESSGEAEGTGGAGGTTPPATFTGRTGYTQSFLGDFTVPWPLPGPNRIDDVLAIDGTHDNLLSYEHFSIMMSASRRMALVVGVNIDGASTVKVQRGKDKWYFDGRVPSEAQLGNDLYNGNLLDRGHLVRREDPNWGSNEAANIANEDTFHFPNCAPQMSGFNQKTWLSLENYILDNTRRWQDRATIFTGPVFRDDDLEYRNARIPTAFWKVVAFLSDDGRPSATAYIIDQKNELSALEAAFGRFKTYQCSVASIEALSGLSFGELAQYDGFSNEEVATGESVRHPIDGPGDILV